MTNDKRARIGIFTRPIDKGTSGSGHHLHEMVRTILRTNREQNKFEFFLIHYVKTDRDVYRQAEEIIIPRNPLAAARVLRKYNFDLLHHSPLTIFSPLAGLTVKRVATIHSAEPNIIPQYYNLAERAHARYIKPVYARKMDHIFTVSETSKRYFTEQWGVDPQKVSVCYNAVSPLYRKLDNPVTAPLKYGITGRYIFHISKYSQRKNPWGLLRGFSSLVSRTGFDDLSLIIAGSGWENPEVVTYLEREGLAGKVVCTGFTPDDQVVELYNGACCFVFPSRAEGFGMPNVEAMACGCPVITTNSFAIPEIVADAAIVLPDPDDYTALADSMEMLLTDDSLKTRLITRGFERAAEFSWEKSARTVLDVYEKLTSVTGE